jgi:hypothetical protein
LAHLPGHSTPCRAYGAGEPPSEGAARPLARASRRQCANRVWDVCGDVAILLDPLLRRCRSPSMRGVRHGATATVTRTDFASFGLRVVAFTKGQRICPTSPSAHSVDRALGVVIVGPLVVAPQKSRSTSDRQHHGGSRKCASWSESIPTMRNSLCRKDGQRVLGCGMNRRCLGSSQSPGTTEEP